MAAEVGSHVVAGQAEQVGAFQAQHQGAVLEEGLLDGGAEVAVHVVHVQVALVALRLDRGAELELPAAFDGEAVIQLRDEDGLAVELRLADAGRLARVLDVDGEPLRLHAEGIVHRPGADGRSQVHEG